jgi:transposase
VKWFSELPAVYLHRQPVDFRKAINGLCVLVEQEMTMSPYNESLFVFCNRGRDKLKILHWDKTGFVLWYKRLEKEKFKWPIGDTREVIEVNEQALNWLLTGLEIWPPEPHKTLHYQVVS